MSEFKIRWEAPSDVKGGLESLCALRTATSTAVGLTAAALGGGYSIRESFSHGEFIAGILGISAFSGVHYVFTRVIDTIYGEQQTLADQLSKRQGADVARFVYKGESVECVLRPEYLQAGKVFEIQGADPLRELAFEFYPQELRFRFKFPVNLAMGEITPFVMAKRKEAKDLGFSFIASNQVFPMGEDCVVDLTCEIAYRGEPSAQRLRSFCDYSSKALADAAITAMALKGSN